MAKVMNPTPPISIRITRTSCPKNVQVLNVSNRIRPVTQVADVAVKKQSENGILAPVFDDIGSQSRNAPTRITRTKPTGMICVGVSMFQNLPIFADSDSLSSIS